MLNITCPVITVNPPTTATGTVGTALAPAASYTFTQTGGAGNINYALTTGALPTGITLGANGTLSGTPSQSGSFPITVTATDANGCTGVSATYTLVINCQNITVTNPATMTGTVGAPFSANFTQVGGLGSPINFTLNSGSLPNGLLLGLNGQLSGTPTQNGSFTLTVKATDGNGCMGVSSSYTLVISCPTITISPANLPGGTYGVAYNQTISATPAGTYSYTVTTGSLPPGLSLNATTGVLNGTPVQVGTFPFTVTANYYGSCLQTKTYSITIGCPPITFEPPNLQPGTIGSPYTQTVVASPLTGYTYSVSAGSLPSGVTLNPATGVISGTPTLIGSYNFTILATGSGALATCSGSKAYTIVINCRVVTVTPPTGLPGGRVGDPYSQTVGATPAGSYTFTLANGSLPQGLSLNASTGVISGTPTLPGTYNFIIRATDPDTCSGTQAYSIVISCPTIVLSPATLPTGTIGGPYPTTNITASPAGGNYTFAVSSGALPAGLTLTSGGVLSGTPTQAGNFPIIITATDANQCMGSRSYTLVVNTCPQISIEPQTLPNAVSGSAYNQALTAIGGTAPYTFTRTGSLPAGITLSSAGVLSGTPTQTGSFSFTVTATDANNCTGVRPYTLTSGLGCVFDLTPQSQGFTSNGGNAQV
ncbi:MAG: Ig domain-containing protein, partial [Acidobacteriota bacterium]|nr:Ig domain-containing protein [Acidobacteriota bacterium]